MPAENTSRGTNSMNAIDTNVFVYAFDADEPVKQAKKQAGIDVPYTEDLDAGANYDGLRIVNPFA